MMRARSLEYLDQRSNWARTSGGLYIPIKPTSQLNAVDLFAGCGGFSLGVEAAGIDVVAAVEWDAAAAISYLYNLGHRNGCLVGYVDEDDQARLLKAVKKAGGKSKLGKALWESGKWVGANRSPDSNEGCRALMFGDASQVTGSEILDLLRAQGWQGEIDLVIGGPPCQGMSTSNTKAKPEDPRNNLILEFLRLTSELGASTFLMENVPPLLEGKKFRQLRQAFFEKAGELGYSLVANIVNAVHYGVPQIRRRAVIWGYKPHMPTPNFPMPTHWGLRVRDGEVVANMLHTGQFDKEQPEAREPSTPAKELDQMELF